MIRFAILLFLSTVIVVGQTLTFGVFSYRSSEKILKEYQPIAEHLSRELNMSVIIKPLSQGELENAVHEGKVDLIATNPTHYLSLRKKAKVTSSIATLIKRYGDITTSQLGGVIIVRHDRNDIRNIDDLKGKALAIPGKTFLGGYQTQKYELLLKGVDVDKEMTTHIYKSHDAIVEAVRSGHVDAGFIRTGIIEEMVRDSLMDDNELYVLHELHHVNFPLKVSTHLYPEWSVVASQKLPELLVTKIVVALYGYSNPKEGNDIIAGFTISGDYVYVDDLARTLRIPPYEIAPFFTMQDIWDKYKEAIVIFVVALLAFIVAIGWVTRKMNRQKKYARSILEASPNPMLVTDGKDLVDTNIILLTLAGYETLEDFKQKHRCICDFFEVGDTNEYLLPTVDDRVWIEHILMHPQREHKAKVTVGGETAVFKVTASAIDSSDSLLAVVVFTDISSIVNQSTIDALTGLANRLHFDLLFAHAIAGAQREKTPLSLIFFDIDHFKKVNDIFGHLAGDEVLRHIAHLVKSSLRKSDLIARWGGEEFIILLPNTSLNIATRLAQNIRKIVALEKFEDVGYLTCSFGVTQLGEDEEEDSVLRRIDTLLYQAKENGRNTVISG